MSASTPASSTPLEMLMERFLPSAAPKDAGGVPDKSFLFTFLLSARLFVRPRDLLSELGQTLLFRPTSTPAERELLAANMLTVLKEWTCMFPNDFQDTGILSTFSDICAVIVAESESLRPALDDLTGALFHRLLVARRFEQTLMGTDQESALRLQHMPATRDLLDVCPSPLQLAQQLTLIEIDRLRHLGPEEFVQAFALESSRVQSLHRQPKRVQFLEAYVQWFNRLSYVVATEICQHVKKKNRLKVVEYFIDTAKECFNIGNFNSLMAIMAGLNMAPVARLKRTWTRVNTDKFDVLEHQMNPARNFHCYRSTLKAALWRCQGATDQRERFTCLYMHVKPRVFSVNANKGEIVIPFFSLFLKDLYFLNELSATKLANGHVNFAKFSEVARHVTDFLTWRCVDCPFVVDLPVSQYLLTTPVFSDDALALASFDCESPDNVNEKVTYRQLKEKVSRAPLIAATGGAPHHLKTGSRSSSGIVTLPR